MGRSELAKIEAWFARRGFGLGFREHDGEVSADLTSLRDGRVVWEGFGGHRTRTALDAARAAKHRYIYQEESPPQPPRRLP